MEELRIKCPSCGIVLEVKNSKNEAVKRIICPNCKKQLAVTFHEEPQSAQYVEIKMVQLADGTQKTIVRTLTDDHKVCVNGEQLLKDDEVVLAPGDKLEIDGKPQFTPQTGKETTTTPVPDARPLPPPVPPTPKRSNWPLHVAIIAFIVVAFVLWQNYRGSKPTDISSTTSADSIIVSQQPETAKKKTDELKPQKEVKVDKRNDMKSVESSGKVNIYSLSDYELEQQAMKGNTDAQCVLGKRFVNKHDSVNVVKGINYLKLAARNGSSEANTTLRRVYAALQQSAANGSSTAENILREQR